MDELSCLKIYTETYGIYYNSMPIIHYSIEKDKSGFYNQHHFFEEFCAVWVNFRQASFL
jgi:hypothetical protein